MILVDLTSEARGAVFAAIATAAPAGWQVFDTVPEGTQPPFVKIGVVETTNEGRPSEQYEHLTVEIFGVYRGEDRGALGAAMFAVRQAIDTRALATASAQFPQCRFIGGILTDAMREKDGVSYLALSHFELLGEPL